MAKIVDNFKRLEWLLDFYSDDTFYFLQIIRRRKDNPDIPNEKSNNYRSIKTYFITSKEQFNSLKDEIVDLCHMFNARAYLGLNKRSFKRTAFETMREISKLIYHEQYHKVMKVYNSCAGYYSTGDKIWIVDVDNTDILNETIEEIKKCDSVFSDQIIDIIPTLNGNHILTRPFNLGQFEPFKVKNNIDVHRNNPTLLYYKQNE